ncbi:MAG: glucosamine-6-phosphate deaminase [archaeon]|nr:glucosamine-6-phosphate deaminase [archaeon]
MVKLNIFKTKEEMGKAAAEKAAEILKNAIKKKNKAYFIVATGASQFEFLDNLCIIDGIEWDKTVMFHLDEYIGLSSSHPASFRHYLKTRFVDRVLPGEVHFIKGNNSDPEKECNKVGKLISKIKIDVAFVGIGENGHIAFNDPPADFDTIKPYLIVDLDKKCRQQQVGEGWFKNIDEVPKQAISMSVNEIMRAENILCIVPDERKAEAVSNCISEEAIVSPKYPSSILKNHKNLFCYLDHKSASLLK